MIRFYFLVLLSFLSSCSTFYENSKSLEKRLTDVPRGFSEIEYPQDNHFSLIRWKLGKKLFFDTRLSRNSTISCASCHNPSLAFTDGQPKSIGIDNQIGRRNTTTLANVAYSPYFMNEGGVPTLEMQVLVPFQEHQEFDVNILKAVERLKKEEEYQQLATEAYGREFDYYVITRALANFQRTLLSGTSRYDQFKQGDTEALTALEQKGMNLFFDEENACSACHSGELFTNHSFENNGLYEEYQDAGRYRLTHKTEDSALFKVPTLRNVAITAPYMHDGSKKSLMDVLEHYNTGGKIHPNKSKVIKPLNLDHHEVLALHAFLGSLTDSNFIKNNDFNEF